MQDILTALRANGATGVVTIADLIRAGGWPEIDKDSAYIRIRALPEGERPIDHGAFNAGGRIAWASPEAAAAWLDHHREYWARRQALPYGQRGRVK
jgi:hypothetical protein